MIKAPDIVITIMIKRFLGLLACTLVVFTSCSPTQGDEGGSSVLDTLRIARTLRFELPKDSIIVGDMEFAQINLCFVYPRNNEQVYRNLAKSMFARDIDVSNPYATLQATFARFEEELIELSPLGTKPLTQDTLTHLDRDLGMYIELFNEMVYSDKSIVSFAMHSDSYTGGVHGSQNTSLCSFSVESGLPIGERDIFVDDVALELNSIIADRIMQDKGVKTKAELMDQYGIDITSLSMADEVLPNNNFLITKEGLRYCFNTYEIGPYSIGKIWVDIPWLSVAHLIKPNSIASQYIE